MTQFLNVVLYPPVCVRPSVRPSVGLCFVTLTPLRRGIHSLTGVTAGQRNGKNINTRKTSKKSQTPLGRQEQPFLTNSLIAW